VQYRSDAAPVDVQDGVRNGQAETARPHAARIEIEDVLAEIDGGLVRVAVDDDREALPSRIDIYQGEVMHDMQLVAMYLQCRRRGPSYRPGFVIDVASHDGHRRDLLELREEGAVADIACMDEPIYARQRIDHVRSQDAVRV